jgi:hypothetical protein
VDSIENVAAFRHSALGSFPDKSRPEMHLVWACDHETSKSRDRQVTTWWPESPVSGSRTLVTVKGDRVEVLVDIGESVRQFDVEATKAGRRVEVSSSRGMIEVVEVTRTGQPVRSARFMSTRVVAIVEHPSE